MPEIRKCPACAEEILAEAKKCKHCGEWLDGSPQAVRATNIVTTEATGKTWKGLMVGGLLLGLGSCAILQNRTDPTDVGVFIAFSLIGVGMMVVGLVGGWWRHG